VVAPPVLPPLDGLERGEQRLRRQRGAHGDDGVHVIGLRPLADVRAAATIPGRGLARRFLAAARGQRIRRTRTHVAH
jgi:hypothetical protein